MNFFEINPLTVFIEDENDLTYIKSNLNRTTQGGVEIGDIFILETREYIVKPLDTIERLAKIFNISESAMESIAGGRNLFIGQKIVLDYDKNYSKKY